MTAGIDAEVQSRNPIRLLLGARERPDDVQQFFLGQADQRAAQQRAERERVAAIGEDAGQRDQVLDLLAAEQALAGLSRHRDAAPLQRFFIAPQIAPVGASKAMSPGWQGRSAPLRRSMMGWLPISRAHMSATASASASRCCSAQALPFSSATAMSRAATHRPRRDRHGTGRAR